MANGILVVPEEKELIKVDEEGMKYPIDTPTAIAIKIHSVKYLSKKLNFLRSFAGAQLFADIIIRYCFVLFSHDNSTYRTYMTEL